MEHWHVTEQDRSMAGRTVGHGSITPPSELSSCKYLTCCTDTLSRVALCEYSSTRRGMVLSFLKLLDKSTSAKGVVSTRHVQMPGHSPCDECRHHQPGLGCRTSPCSQSSGCAQCWRSHGCGPQPHPASQGDKMNSNVCKPASADATVNELCGHLQA